MKQIIVGKKNLGTVISIVRNLVSKPFSTEGAWDLRNLKESGFVDSEMQVDLHRKAIVKKHWLANDQYHNPAPLVHIDFLDELNFLVLYEGDKIILLGGGKFLIQQKNTGVIKVLGKKNLNHLFKRINLSAYSDDELTEQEVKRADELHFYKSMDEDYEEELLNMSISAIR